MRSPAVVDALAGADIQLGEDFLDQSEQELLHRLAIDYTQLFHGPGGHIAPYESVQTGLPGTSLNSKSTDRLRDLMASAGFADNEDTGELIWGAGPKASPARRDAKPPRVSIAPWPIF
jgi:TorA maturation chaperone TorD